MKLLLSIVTLALFTVNAQAAIKGELQCEFTRELYTNNQIPAVKVAPIEGDVYSDTDTDKYIAFKSGDIAVEGGYTLRIEGGYNRSGVIPSEPGKISWDPNGGSVYFDAVLLKNAAAPGGQFLAVAKGFAHSDLISSPYALEELKKGQAAKKITTSAYLQSTEYATLQANNVDYTTIDKDLLTSVSVVCTYVQK